MKVQQTYSFFVLQMRQVGENFLAWRIEISLHRMTEITPKELYTTKETQDFLKVSSSTMKRMIKNGIITAHRVGGTWRIWGDDILMLVSPELEKKVYWKYKKLKDKTKETIEKW